MGEDDFDDFGEPADANDDDFGDFDDFDDFAGPAEEDAGAPESTSNGAPAPAQPRIPCLSETDFSNSVSLQASIAQILRPIYSAAPDTASASTESDTEATYDSEADPTASRVSVAVPSLVTPNSGDTSTDGPPSAQPTYFTERSSSLWNQLAIVQPQATASGTEWKRSAIRRLFMVSLGVPLDLDEILPQKNTKRLVLPAVRPHRSSRSRSRSRSRARPDGEEGNANSGDGARKSKTNGSPGNELELDTDKNVQTWSQLSNVSELALAGMTPAELADHTAALKSAAATAAQTLALWENKKQLALKDKDDFESLIESLVEYAQRSGNGKSSKSKSKKK